MKTAEEIFDHAVNLKGLVYPITMKSIIDAMQSYAKQEAIEFNKWLWKNDWKNNDRIGRFYRVEYHSTAVGLGLPSTQSISYKTIEELYKLYKNSNQ